MGISSIQGGMAYQGMREMDALRSRTGEEDGKKPESAKEAPAASPSYDEYIPSGQSDPESDKEGKIPSPDESDKEKMQHCVANTDKVDREIERLKQEKAQLEQQLRQAKDNPEKEQELKMRLQKVESELGMKDNDAYRKRNTTFTNID